LTRRLEEINLTTPEDAATLQRIIDNSQGDVRDLLTEAAKDGLTGADIGYLSEAIRLLSEAPAADPSVIWDLTDITVALDPLTT